MAIWAVGPILGPVISPVVGGFLVTAKDGGGLSGLSLFS
jgi:hypothetical protein